MERIVAIGDIHGCNEALQIMLFEEINIKKTDHLYFLGDYIDRGPDSKGVIDTLINLQQENYNIHTLRGNHEEMMMDSYKNFESFIRWYSNGGIATLESFGVDSYADMEKEYRDFFEQTKFYTENGKYIFTHAGLNFDRPDIFADKEAMLWARGFKPNQSALFNKILIHGHTPKSLSYINEQKGNCINIDGGCVYADRKNLGNLVAISLPEKEFIVVENKY